MHRSPRPGLAVLLVALLAVGGCSDDETDRFDPSYGGSTSSYGGSSQAGSGAGAAGAPGGQAPGGAAGQGSAGVGGSGEVDPSTCSDEATCAGFRTPPGEGTPPAPPGSGGPATGGKSVQAVSGVFLGAARRDGTADPEAWKSYGFDLDGWSSTPGQGFHCRPQGKGKAKNIRADGEHGIDNGFGRLVNGGFASFLPTTTDQSIRQEIAAGAPTLLLAIDALGSASDYPALTGHVTMAQTSSGTPAGDGFLFPWQPWSTPAPLGFDQGYLTGNTLVVRLGEPLAMTLSLPDLAMRLRIHQARLSLDLSDRAHGVNGQLGGILDPEELITTLWDDANEHSWFPCEGGTTYEGIADMIRTYADILMDGTQDPTRTCDGISIGLGFDTRAALEGASVTPPKVFSCDGP